MKTTDGKLIGIESAPGEGASFVVRLPMVTEDVEE